MSREVRQRYSDPVDLLWLACARDCGIRVERSEDVYASWDGKGTLTLTASAHFDADDSLAQLIFHELCHALVAGPRALSRPDWGMENVDDRDLIMEHACHRLQAALSDRHGLRTLFAVTTDHRAYWDALPVDPLAPGEDPAIPLAREGWERARFGAWSKPLERALAGTAKIAALVREAGTECDELWASTQGLHVTGFPLSRNGALRCGDCAWSFVDGAALRCRQSRASGGRGVRIDADARGCTRYEVAFDDEECGACGACCREAFDRVEVRAKDLVKKRHPLLVVRDGYGDHLPRPNGKCVALRGDGTEPYRCQIYEERPRSCADFAVRGDACLTARRRVARSP